MSDPVVDSKVTPLTRALRKTPDKRRPGRVGAVGELLVAAELVGEQPS